MQIQMLPFSAMNQSQLEVNFHLQYHGGRFTERSKDKGLTTETHSFQSHPPQTTRQTTLALLWYWQYIPVVLVSAALAIFEIFSTICFETLDGWSCLYSLRQHVQQCSVVSLTSRSQAILVFQHQTKA